MLLADYIVIVYTTWAEFKLFVEMGEDTFCKMVLDF